MKKIITFICLIAITLTVGCSQPTVNAKEITVNKNVYVKSTLSLKPTGGAKKYKWNTSNKKIATVSKKGKVKAKHSGTATITAKNGATVYKYKITVKKYSLNRFKDKLNKYFIKSDKYSYYFVADDLEPAIEEGSYVYYIRSTGGTQANVLVGRVIVNPKNGKAVLHFDYGEKKTLNVLK